MATRLNGEYDMDLLKNIRELYGFKEDEKKIYIHEISCKIIFNFTRKKYLTLPVLL